MSTIAPPVNIVSGSQVPVAPSTFAVAAPGTIACVIYNSTGAVLTVLSANGSDFLQPNQANVYQSTNSMPVPQVTPTTSAAAGTFIGSIQAVFFNVNDGFPQGFPLPLIPFPGNSVLLAAMNANNANQDFFAGITTNQPTPPGNGLVVNGLTNVAYQFSVLPNATEVTVQIPNLRVLSTSGTVTAVDIELLGVNSGLYSGAVQIETGAIHAGENLGPINVTLSLIGLEDTEFYIGIYLTGTGFPQAVLTPLGPWNVFESSGLAVPSFPINLTRFSITAASSQILAAPTTGAIYLFWVETDNSSAGQFELIVGGVTIVLPMNTADGPPYDLMALRTGQAVEANGGGETGNGTIAWAPGP